LPRIIFWNVHKKELTSLVCSITASTNADVVVLIENNVSIEKTLEALRTNVSEDFYHPNVSSESDKRFQCFCRNSELDLSETHSGIRTSVRKFQIGRYRTLLALVHGIDIRNYDSQTRQSFAQELADQMRFVQEEKGIDKLILLGDFNMNPFESGMNLANGLNAMMTKACVNSGRRTHLNKQYDFYYNPMWSLFGDNTDGPAGTIYDISNQGPYGWSMLDQVIIHHSVVELFHSVKILTEAGTESLMNRQGRPDTDKASDHFPILVSFCEDNSL
jgi:endonuclease/exonuclease/phosphatase (EEP) superfamily protein YafD